MLSTTGLVFQPATRCRIYRFARRDTSTGIVAPD
jgi:hypothetical protein